MRTALITALTASLAAVTLGSCTFSTQQPTPESPAASTSATATAGSPSSNPARVDSYTREKDTIPTGFIPTPDDITQRTGYPVQGEPFTSTSYTDGVNFSDATFPINAAGDNNFPRQVSVGAASADSMADILALYLQIGWRPLDEVTRPDGVTVLTIAMPGTGESSGTNLVAAIAAADGYATIGTCTWPEEVPAQTQADCAVTLKEIAAENPLKDRRS